MTLILVDGKNALVRAAAGTGWLEPDYKGDPNAAAHAFVNTLLRIVRDHGPGALVVVWEGETNWRRTEWPAYKAHRMPSSPAPGDEELAAAKAERKLALEHVRRELSFLLELFGVRQAEPEDGEADDALATLAVWAGARGGATVCTADLDLLQVVDAERGVRVVTTAHASAGGGATSYETADHVFAKFGVMPTQIPDHIAIAGDPSDGIPGVPGLGDKAARVILDAHSTLEEAIEAARAWEHGSFCSTKRKAELLVEHADAAALYKRLATLNASARLLWRPRRPARAKAREKALDMGLRYWSGQASFQELWTALAARSV